MGAPAGGGPDRDHPAAAVDAARSDAVATGAAVDPAAVRPELGDAAATGAAVVTCSEDASTAFSFPESFLCCGSSTRDQLRMQFGPVDVPASPGAAAGAAGAFFLAHVPSAALPGSTIRVQAPEGGSILDVVIPPGATPGSTLSIMRPFSRYATSADATIKELKPPSEIDDPGELERKSAVGWQTGKVRLVKEKGPEPQRCCWPFNGIRSPTTASAPWRASTRTRTR